MRCNCPVSDGNRSENNAAKLFQEYSLLKILNFTRKMVRNIIEKEN
jgi:hypothetical protein